MKLSNERMENKNMFLTWAPIVISVIAAFFAYRANSINREGFRENFRSRLIEKLKEAKNIILHLEIKEYEHREKMLLIEPIRDHLLYQQNSKEKKKYMSADEMSELSLLQEKIDDNLEILLSGTDGETNRDLAINYIKNFLSKF